MARRVLRWLVIAVLVIGYPLLAYYTSKATDNPSLGAVVAISPLALIALVLAWRSPRRFSLLCALLLAGAALWLGWPVLEQHFGLVYWLQHAGLQLILFITFARTLIAGRKPLCTRFAEAVHAPLTPQHEHYSRQVTLAWALFFAAMVLVSSGLFFLTPLSVWSFFANFMTLPLVAVMFVAEYWVRRSVLSHTQHMRLMDAVRAFRNTSARPR